MRYTKTKLLFLLIIFLINFIGCAKEKSHLNNAIKTANWLESVKIENLKGITWPADPNDSTSIASNLYSGSPGVVLFFLELFHSTKDQKYLKLAKSGADYLIETLPEKVTPGQTGFYTGIAGIGFVLEETYKASNDSKYHDGALRCVDMLHNSVKQINEGVDWNNVTDIISGSSGIGLFLLYAAEQMEHQSSLGLAVKAGRHLMKLGIPEKEGFKWPMSSDYPRLMPNFSHGTAGVCYFLCSLYEKTNQEEFLKTALKGANYLLEITNEQGFIFHHEPEGEDLCYLGWCHGPPGTSRLYYKLWQITNEKKWLNAIEKSAQGILKSGIPETQVPGFWNNVSQCCGNVGIADFFLNLYKITKKNEYLDFVKKLTENLMSQATIEANGLKWIQAEHRTRPDFLVAQTGFMQGAAGIGMWLLNFDAFDQNKKSTIKFPDSPF